MKSEPKKKSFKWIVSENKILSISDVDRLRDARLEFNDEQELPALLAQG